MFDFGISEIFAAKQRQENSGEEVEGAKGAAAGFGGIKPAGVGREQDAVEVAALLEFAAKVELAGDGVAVEAVAGNLGAAVGG